ncbi:TIGR03905 family TSCPD domain-containing protein [Faecalispora anaeroviscerum]|uniref:TIGR03905 family TSCPD domain-containing protein n=1 Tax=Faecalispora anaeroviscerum TaxID=2991836 RepID=UPI0024BAC6D5|nr:TIGR03905 family TSCPD domain-containing protein [Faecalispora anaeroviscerum]
MQYEFHPNGVCSSRIFLEVDGDTVQKVQFVGGCSGNSQGIGALVQGMKVDEVIARLQGIRCGRRNTSCPDQLAQALLLYQSKNKTDN